MIIEDLRARIDIINTEMLELFRRRMELSARIAELKKSNGVPIHDKKRESQIIEYYAQDDHFTHQFFTGLMRISRDWQTHITLTHNIVLIGMMGSGKTMVGQMVSERLGLDYLDIDNCIEERTGTTISDLIEDSEEQFRDLEAVEMAKAAQKKGCVIATGGGVVLREENMRKLKENGIVYFLNRPVKSIMSDIKMNNRPLLQNRLEVLQEIYAERMPLYKGYADVEINALHPQDFADEIVSHLQAHGIF